MEAIKKEVKKGKKEEGKENGLAGITEDFVKVEPSGIKASLEVTKEDLGNLKVIFDWALQVSTRDRQRLVSIVTFENSFIEKLEKLLKKE